MSVQKHTPGPWRVGTSNAGKSCVWLDGHAEPKNEMGSDSTWIDCNTEANARLIATAPELLEFARLVLRGLKVGNFKAMPVINLDDDAEQLDVRSLADIASEIIAKAEGI